MPVLILEWRKPTASGSEPMTAQRMVQPDVLTDTDELTEEIFALLSKHMPAPGMTVNLHRSPRARSGRFRYEGHSRGHGTWKVQP